MGHMADFFLPWSRWEGQRLSSSGQGAWGPLPAILCQPGGSIRELNGVVLPRPWATPSDARMLQCRAEPGSGIGKACPPDPRIIFPAPA